MSGERLDGLEAELAVHLELAKRVREHLSSDAGRIGVLEAEVAELRRELELLDDRLMLAERRAARADSSRDNAELYRRRIGELEQRAELSSRALVELAHCRLELELLEGRPEVPR